MYPPTSYRRRSALDRLRDCEARSALRQYDDRSAARDKDAILQADKVILPGVGSFGDAMNNLDKFDLIDPIKKCVDNKTPFLGICLGLQLLFESSDESEKVDRTWNILAERY